MTKTKKSPPLAEGTKRGPESGESLKSARDNRANQLNPNNPTFRKSREEDEDFFIDEGAGIPDGGFLD